MTAAGNWGDYQCDVPYRTLESLMQFIAGMSDEVRPLYLVLCHTYIAWRGSENAVNPIYTS